MLFIRWNKNKGGRLVYVWDDTEKTVTPQIPALSCERLQPAEIELAEDTGEFCKKQFFDANINLGNPVFQPPG